MGSFGQENSQRHGGLIQKKSPSGALLSGNHPAYPPECGYSSRHSPLGYGRGEPPGPRKDKTALT